MEKEVITVNYYYKKKKTIAITVKYIDEETNVKIQENIKIEGYEGKEYKTEQKKIDGYEFTNVIGETEGTMTQDKEIIYYYKKVKEPENPKDVEENNVANAPGESQDHTTINGATQDPTTINKAIPVAGLTKEKQIIIVAVVIAIIGVLMAIGMKDIKKY